MTNTKITDEDWIRYLKERRVIENDEERAKREKVLLLLKSTISEFTRTLIKENGYNKNERMNCFLSPFGSYGLGGYIRDADIDVVLVCPNTVKRNDFFRILPNTLRKQPTIREIEKIRHANVPIIKCVVDNISIDISFIRLSGLKCDENMDFLDDRHFHGMDSTCIASMDGPRVNTFIKRQIRVEHIRIFQYSLQCIKYWAITRQIYNKPIGYLNGSSWTLLLLKTYMDLRNDSGLTITQLLLTFLKQWRDWPWPAPVLLTSEIPGKGNSRIDYASLTEFEDAIMPIVSPCYPVSSAAPNVTKSTLKIMTRELQRACIILDDPSKEPATLIEKFFNPVEYFKRYQNFIVIITSTTTQSSCETWQRKMANMIPQLIQMIEKCPQLNCIQPVTKPITHTRNFKTQEEKRALEAGYPPSEAQRLSQTGTLNPGLLYLVYFCIGIKPENNCTSIDLAEQIELFEKLLEARRNSKHDNDVKWNLTSMNRKRVYDIVYNRET